MLHLFENIRYSQTGLHAYIGEAELNYSHIIFKAHFPGYPILPGVLILQFVNMMMSKVIGHQLQLSNASNVKFIKPIIPEGNNNMKIEFDFVEENNGYLLNAKIYFQDEMAAHVKHLTYIRAN